MKPNAQWEQRRIPSDFSPEARRWAQSIYDVFDEIYYKYGRLKFEELSETLRERIEDGEGNVSELQATANRIMLAVSGGSTVYSQDTAPTSPVVGDLWYDTSETPVVCNRYEDGTWVSTGLTNLIDQLGTVASLILTSDEIMSVVSSSSVYQSDMAAKADAEDLGDYALTTYVNELNSTEITQRNDAIALSVSSEKTRAESVEGEIKSFTDIAKTYFLFNDLGLSIGKSGSPFKTVLTDNKLSFYEGEVEVAYISNNKMYISNAEIIDILTVGNATDGWVDIDTVGGGFRGSWRAE